MAWNADYTLDIYDHVTGHSHLNLTPYVSAITPSYQRRSPKVITAIDGREYAFGYSRRHIVRVDFKPMTGAQLKRIYDYLDAAESLGLVWFRVEYKCPTNGGGSVILDEMRIENDFEHKFLHTMIDDNKYYAGFQLVLREQ